MIYGKVEGLKECSMQQVWAHGDAHDCPWQRS